MEIILDQNLDVHNSILNLYTPCLILYDNLNGFHIQQSCRFGYHWYKDKFAFTVHYMNYSYTAYLSP